MGFVDREMMRIEAAISAEPHGTARFRELFAAQQALKWTTEPRCFAAPLDSIDRVITGDSLAAPEGYLVESRPAMSSDTPGADVL